MTGTAKHSIIIDLKEFKLHLHFGPETEYTLHFNTPSRRFYLSVIALVVHEMKKHGAIVSIPLHKHDDLLALFNETIGGSAGSSEKKQLLSRIYRKWKDALPDLENAPLFKIVGRSKNYNLPDSKFGFSETVKDTWANLFEYRGSHADVRLRFSIDRLGLSPDDIVVLYGADSKDGHPNGWKRYIASLELERTASKPNADHGDRQLVPDYQKSYPIAWSPKAPSRRLSVVIGTLCVALLVIVGGWMIWNAHVLTPETNESVKDLKADGVLPEKPSLAVLPFDNMTGDPQQDYFSDGMTEQIITSLSQEKYINVTSRTSSFSFRDKAMTAVQIAEELGVQYLLEGSVQRDKGTVRITVQLVDGHSGNHAWAEHYDYKYEDLFALQDKITMEVMSGLDVNSLGFPTSANYKKLRPGNLEAYEHYLNAHYIHLRRRTDEIDKAREEVEKSIRLDPNFAPAHLLDGLIYLDEISRRVTKKPEQALEKAKLCAQRAEKLDPDSPPYLLWSRIYRLQKDYDKAIQYAEKAVERRPNHPYCYFFLNVAQFYGERFEESKATIETGLQLIPFRPVNFILQLGWAYVGLEEYEKAIPLFIEVVERAPTSLFAYLSYKGLAVSYELSGNHVRAAWAAENIMRIKPDYSLEKDKQASGVKEGAFKNLVFSAYQRAGLR